MQESLQYGSRSGVRMCAEIAACEVDSLREVRWGGRAWKGDCARKAGL